MTLVVQTNTTAMFAAAALTANQRSSATAMERLSTGFRINSAKDDAAGMAIANKMTSNIKGLAQAIKNINDGISLLETADGAFELITDIAQRLRELSVQASNGTYTNDDRTFMQAEATALQNEMIAIVERTEWNNHKLLNGAFINKSIQLGIGSDAGSKINIDLIGLSIDDLVMNEGGAKTYGQFVVQYAYQGVTPVMFNARLNSNTPELLTSIDAAWASGSNQTANTSIRLTDFVYGGNGGPTGQGHVTISPGGVVPNQAINIDYTGDVYPWSAIFVNYEYDNGIYTIKSVGSNSSGVTSISATFQSGLTSFGSAINSLDISTRSSASNSIGLIDNFITKINQNRAKIGAYTNAMNYHVNNSTSMSLNLSESRSFIVDANYAYETAELARTEILQYSASAILVQANSRNDLVLELLKNL
jgi:flagellin